MPLTSPNLSSRNQSRLARGAGRSPVLTGDAAPHPPPHDLEEAPTISEMSLQEEDKLHAPLLPHSASPSWRVASSLIVPLLLLLLLLLTLSLLYRFFFTSLFTSAFSVVMSPAVFSWLAASPATLLVPSPLDPSQLIHPDFAYLLAQSHNDTPMIPDIVHFVIGTTHTASSTSPSSSTTPLSSPPRFLLQHWLALKSASEIIQPTGGVYCHVVAEPTSSPYWAKAKPYCTRILPTRPLTHIFGRPVHHAQHKADILRLEALLHYGGTALSLDTLTTRSWKADPAEHALLFKLDVLVGLTQSAKVNWADRFDASWVAARVGSALVKEWYGAYRMFNESGGVAERGEGWVVWDDRVLQYSHAMLWKLSVVRPHQLTTLQPSVIGLPFAWEPEGVKQLYGVGGDWKPAGWTVHLWQGEHEGRKEVLGKAGEVVSVEGVVAAELEELYRVDSEQAVCALGQKSAYGRLLLQAMNGVTVAYECPK